MTARPAVLAVAAGLLLAGPPVPAADPPGVADAVRAIRAVGREGAGAEAAAAGWQRLVAAGPAALVPTLAAFDGASPQAANWLRPAVDAIAGAERKAGRPLPAADLEAFVKDPARAPAARRIAFELLAGQSKEAAAKLLPALVDDPSPELRRDAVAARLKAAGPNPGRPALEPLFAVARDKDQVEELAKLLAAAGAEPDVPRHFGLVTEWAVAGPFPSPGGAGFAGPFPPDAGYDPAGKYPGKDGATVGWTAAQSDSPDGTIDLTKVVGKYKDAAAYAAAVLRVDRDTPCEVRVSTPNAVRILLNGRKLFEREEYHHGASWDQYVGRGALTAGRNVVLLKVVQNDQKESWAQTWEFAARVCDPTGGPLPLTQLVVRDGKEVAVTPGAIKPGAKKEPK